MTWREQLSEIVRETRGRLAKESDSGCVLVACALIDRELQRLLTVKMATDSRVPDAERDSFEAKLRKYFAPGHTLLGSFWAKIEMCWAFGLIDNDLYVAIDKMRDLRNGFAHPKEPTELSPEKLRTVASSLGKDLAEVTKRFTSWHVDIWPDFLDSSESAQFSEARVKFMNIAASMVGAVAGLVELRRDGQVPYQSTDPAS